ncbi:MAG: FAD-binding oxidoreductase [Chloroflexota bacterium]|nr:FAD-binding oxidoreductase [Chloroflexota bacterium]
MVSTPQVRSGSVTSFSLDAEIAAFRSRVAGRVIIPGDAEYDTARLTVNVMSNRFPLMILKAAEESDVVEAVRFARTHGVQLSIRSGGHSVPRLNVIDDALVVDYSEMKAVRIDPVGRVARVQPGATSWDLAIPAAEHDLALSTGDTQSVGMGGLTTGGGIGFMVRKYGLAIDNLISARVVTADARVLTASAVENPDLFWAIRGGGSNFGIITEFTYRLAHVPQILGGDLMLPATREVLRGYLEITTQAPDDLTTIANMMKAPPFPYVPEDKVGTPVFSILTVWTGDPEEGERVIGQLRALAEPVADTIAPVPYPEIYKYTVHQTARHGAAIRMMFADDMSDASLDASIEAIENSSSPFSLIQFRGMGGYASRIDKHATAFPHRTQNVFYAIIGLWLDPAEDPAPHFAWSEALWEKVRGDGSGVYVNFLDHEGQDRIREAYGDVNYERLVRIKAHYDPDNMFRFNQNILPAK